MSVELQPGELVFGRYRLSQLIGVGGMGSVWSARDEKGGRKVALKLLHPSMLADPVAIQRFSLEAEAVTALKHRSIVEVFDAGRSSNRPYIAMELLDGATLSDVLKRTTKIPLPSLLDIVRSLAEALAVAHANGIVHRDLKPANVFLHRTREGIVPKLLDFGISKFMNPSQDGGLTATGDLLGSPTYMSPEQVTTPRDVDHRSDIWALGILTYRGITGGYPFDVTNPAVLLAQIGSRDIDLGEVRVGDTSPSVVAIVTKCLERQRDERYGSASEVAAACTAALAELGQPPDLAALVALAQPSSPQMRDPDTIAESALPILPEPFPHAHPASRSRRGIVIGGAVVLVASAIAVAAVASRASPRAPPVAIPNATTSATATAMATSATAAIETEAVPSATTAASPGARPVRLLPLHAPTHKQTDPSRHPGF